MVATNPYTPYTLLQELSFQSFSNFLIDAQPKLPYIYPMKLLMQVIGLCIVLLGSLAIPVYQHTCLHDNVVVSSAFVKTNYCQEEEKEKHGHEKSCCEEEQEDNKCCEDEVSSFQIPFFQVQSDVVPSLFVAVLSESITPVIEIGETLAENKQTVLAYADLPPPKLPKRLALLQVWRI